MWKSAYVGVYQWLLKMTFIHGQYYASWIKLCHSHHTTWNNYKAPIHPSDTCNIIHPAPYILLALLWFGFSGSRLMKLRNSQIQNTQKKFKFFCSFTPYRLVGRLVTFYQLTLYRIFSMTFGSTSNIEYGTLNFVPRNKFYSYALLK